MQQATDGNQEQMNSYKEQQKESVRERKEWEGKPKGCEEQLKRYKKKTKGCEKKTEWLRGET
jgi:hypothetical protein